MGRLRCSSLMVFALACSRTESAGGARPGPGTDVSSGSGAPSVGAAAEAPPQNVSVELGDGFGALRVSSHGANRRLRSAIGVEQRVGEVWQALPITRLLLRTTCDVLHGYPECMALEPGAAMTVAPWTGRLCMAQCPTSCRLDSEAPQGVYRFVVTDCEGGQRFVSRDFDKPAQPDERRWPLVAATGSRNACPSTAS